MGNNFNIVGLEYFSTETDIFKFRIEGCNYQDTFFCYDPLVVLLKIDTDTYNIINQFKKKLDDKFQKESTVGCLQSNLWENLNIHMRFNNVSTDTISIENNMGVNKHKKFIDNIYIAINEKIFNFEVLISIETDSRYEYSRYFFNITKLESYWKNNPDIGILVHEFL